MTLSGQLIWISSLLFFIATIAGSLLADSEGSVALVPSGSSVRLLLAGADGEFVSLDAVSGKVFWRSTVSPIITSSHPDGVPLQKSEDVMVVSLDGGALYYKGSLEPIRIGIRDIVDRAPFQTRNNVRFISSKRARVLIFDRESGELRHSWQCEDACGALDGYPIDSNDSPLLWVGMADYTISAIDISGPVPSIWDITYSETTSFVRPMTDFQDVLAVAPEIVASPSGEVWGRDRHTHSVLWQSRLNSALAAAHIQVGDDIVRIPYRYGIVRTIGPNCVVSNIEGPVVGQISATGQSFVVVNRISTPVHLHNEPDASPITSFLFLPPAEEGADDETSPFSPQEPLMIRSLPAPPKRDSVHITLNLPDSPARFSVLGLVTVLLAFLVRSAVRRIIAYSNSGPSSVRKRHKPQLAKPTDGDTLTHVANDLTGILTIGKISIRTRNVLGLGSQGTIVFEGTFEGRTVAVKRLQKHLYTHANREISLMIESDSHPCVLRYFAREDDNHFIYVAVERCACSLGSVSGISSLISTDMRPLPFAQRILSDVLSGVQFLHSNSIVHQDIKPANILITEEKTAKIADMGLSLRLEQSRSSFDLLGGKGGGSSGWHAAELLQPNARLTRAVDVFSLGCVIYYVITRGLHPFGDSYQRDAAILLGRYNLDAIRHLPEAVDLVQSMLALDPEKRPSCTEVLRHPFFWSDEAKLEFLQEVSDRVEAEKADSPLRVALESQSRTIVGRSWNRVIDPELLDNLGKYRKYQFDSVRDCLRVIRNKKNHYRDLPSQVQESLGSYPSGFLFYFTSRFPSLLLYSFAFAGRFCANESPLSRHFAGLTTSTLQQHWSVWSFEEPDTQNTSIN